MLSPLPLFCIWIIVAAMIGFAPARFHWRGAYALIGLGVPLLIWMAFEQPVWVTALCTLAAASVLRWPLIRLGRWVRARLGFAGPVQ